MPPFTYRVVFSDRVIQEGPRAGEAPLVGDLVPLADSGGRITKVVALTGERADYEIHVMPLDDVE